MPKMTRDLPEEFKLRLDTELMTVLRSVASKNDMSVSDFTRLMIRAGMQAAVDANAAPRMRPKPSHSRADAADRTVYLLEQIDSVTTDLGLTDPHGAELLLRGISEATAQSARQWRDYASQAN